MSLPLRRTLASIVALIDLMLAVLVVLGMASGAHQQAYGVVTQGRAVLIVQALGVVTLLLLAFGLRLCVVAWRGQRIRFGGLWAVAIAAVWLLWAFCRVGEYAS
jgi:hypothetical protein